MYGLLEDDLKTINEILAKYHDIEEVVIFGSRAKGNYRPGSDIDLAIKGEVGDNIVLQVSATLNQETLLPYFFDIVAYKSLDNGALIEHIDRIGKPIYKRASSAP